MNPTQLTAYINRSPVFAQALCDLLDECGKLLITDTKLPNKLYANAKLATTMIELVELIESEKDNLELAA